MVAAKADAASAAKDIAEDANKIGDWKLEIGNFKI